MLTSYTNLQDILFLDIETAPLYADFQQLSEIEKQLWTDKTAYQRKEEISAEEFYQRAGIFSEFGKIICISVGFFKILNGKRQFRLKSFLGDEKKILTDFSALLQNYFNKKNKILCAHNGKEFDFPFIGRRMIINRIPLPEILNLSGKKPWEIQHLDTLELWKFGDYKHYTSLNLLTYVLGIPSPKDDITGAEIADVFYKENDIKRISAYCQKDTLAVAQIFLRLRYEELLKEDEIFISEE